MSRSRTVRAVAAVSFLALVLALTGCSDDGEPTPTPTASGPASSAPGPSPSASATSSATTSPTSSASPSPTATLPAGFSLGEKSSPGYPSLGGDLGAIGGVRVGRHPGFDRVVWEFPGSGRPSFQVHYVDQPIADGSGDVVDVAGAAYLEVLVSSVGIPPANAPRPGNAPTASIAGTVVAQAGPVYGGFEAIGQTFVGVRDRERPFKVTVLTKPTRLVVDIASG